MVNKIIAIVISSCILLSSCGVKKQTTSNTASTNDSALLYFAKSYLGTKYTYGGNKPSTGFDCSGFVQFVFTHFHYKVPRVANDFATIGKTIQPIDAKPEDIILFAGKDGNLKTIQHIGIITDCKNNDIHFIHSSSSKGVMISNLNSYFHPRFIKIIRLQASN
jgi:murein DD-endopeptidase / murein LD-carboxypeptidase